MQTLTVVCVGVSEVRGGSSRDTVELYGVDSTCKYTHTHTHTHVGSAIILIFSLFRGSFGDWNNKTQHYIVEPLSLVDTSVNNLIHISFMHT